MRICLINYDDRSERVIEIDQPEETNNPSIMAVKDCYKIIDGEKLPIYIPRMGEAATIIHCDYVFRKYGPK